MATYIICGLGNPGQEYEKTRHNAGFLAVDRLQKQGFSGWKGESKFESLVCEKTDGSNKIYVIKPLTFMNKSGVALQKIAAYYKVQPENCLVIYDDIDLELGKIRLRKSGGPGTHNGMKSIIAHMGTEEFPRLRIGIGAPQPSQKDLSTHVLEPFTKSESSEIGKIFDETPQIVEDYIQKGIELAMTKWN